ncbi:hypothetical protein ACJJTC_019323 [Scirpophaga incertulas]
MPKYYCDYCDTYLTHDSPSVRKTHCTGRKHKDNVKFYYQKWMEEQAQHLIDATTAAFKAGKIAQNPFGAKGAAIPPPWDPYAATACNGAGWTHGATNDDGTTWTHASYDGNETTDDGALMGPMGPMGPMGQMRPPLMNGPPMNK